MHRAINVISSSPQHRELSDNRVDLTMEESTEDSTTMELSLSLDSDGRTKYDPQKISSTNDGDEEKKSPAKQPDDVNIEPNAKRLKTSDDNKVSPSSIATLDYSSKTIQTNLSNITSIQQQEEAMNNLLFDCEIADSGLLPRTFWISAEDNAKPRCYLEKLALEVFRHHVPDGYVYDKSTSGAEWWVQLRPSPPAGRYAMHCNDDKDDDMTNSGINFHWDKDEDLRIMVGGSMYIHPHISTVTYLTDLGAPTMVVSKRVHPMTGEYIQEINTPVEGYVSWPKRGKHLSFDGRYLHAAPSDIMVEGMFDKQCQFDTTSDMDTKAKRILTRQHRRVTFLVNIWLNHKPFNVNPFPKTMIGNLSKIDLFGSDMKLFNNTEQKDEKMSHTTTKVLVNKDGVATLENGSKVDLIKKTWSMGQKDETIDVQMPVDTIREQQTNGSDITISWSDGGVDLSGTSA